MVKCNKCGEKYDIVFDSCPKCKTKLGDRVVDGLNAISDILG